ncbi:MAG: hypothetical protein JNN04_05720 [Cyclobacteriaceae bacterium]|nr:hypothetical protein [Cyclobacteriaceae bacterium]
MSIKTVSYTAFGLILAGCTGFEFEQTGKRLVETNHSYGGFYARFHYANERIDELTFHGGDNNWQETYLTVVYLDPKRPEISVVEYYPNSSDPIRRDTLVYDGGNLTHIVKSSLVDGLKRQDTVFFSYDGENKLIEARFLSKRLTFSNYQNGDACELKVYQDGQLVGNVAIKYDKGRSPFSELGYLNLVIFGENYLEGFEYLTDHNAVEWTEIRYAGVTLTSTSLNAIDYDLLSRPLNITQTRVGESEFKLQTYFKYQ